MIGIAGKAHRCPNCKFLMEKDGGCTHMKCAICHFEFCWICGMKFYTHMHKYLTFDGIGCEIFGMIFEKQWNVCLKSILLVLLFILWPILFLIGSIAGGIAVSYKCFGQNNINSILDSLPCCFKMCPFDGVGCVLYSLVCIVPWLVVYSLIFCILLVFIVPLGLVYAALIYGILLLPTMLALLFIYFRCLYIWSGDC